MERMYLVGEKGVKRESMVYHEATYKRLCEMLGVEEIPEVAGNYERANHRVELRKRVIDELNARLKEGFWASWSFFENALVIVKGPAPEWVKANIETPEVQAAIKGLRVKIETGLKERGKLYEDHACVEGRFGVDEFSEIEHVLLAVIIGQHIENPFEFSPNFGLGENFMTYTVYMSI